MASREAGFGGGFVLLDFAGVLPCPMSVDRLAIIGLETEFTDKSQDKLEDVGFKSQHG